MTTTPLIQPSDRIFVAWHRGMAGSATCRALRRKGYGNLLTVPRSELDLEDAVAVREWFEAQRPEVVVLAAAKVGGIHFNSTYPSDFLLDNLKIQTHVIESAWRNRTRRLMFLGSSCIYPRECPQPIREESLLTGPLEPTSMWYAIAKIAGIQLYKALRKEYGLDAISRMPTNLYGPGDHYHHQNGQVIATMIHRFHEAKQANDPRTTCWKAAKPMLESPDADDLGEACVRTIPVSELAPEDSVQDINVGTRPDLRIDEIINRVSQTVGPEGEIAWDHTKPDGTSKKKLDATQAEGLGCGGWQRSCSAKALLMFTQSSNTM